MKWNNFLTYVCLPLMVSSILFDAIFSPLGCKGFEDPVSVADKAFMQAVRHDVDEVVKRVVLLEQKIDDKVDRLVVKALEDALAKLQLQMCKCDPDGVCKCGGDKPVNATQSWFQSSTDPNIYYWGSINKDGVLIYTYVYYANQNVVVPALKGATGPNNTGSQTKSFLSNPVVGIRSPSGK